MEKSAAINLHFDRDNVGIKCTQKPLEWNDKYMDRSDLWTNLKRLNQCLVAKKSEEMTRLEASDAIFEIR